MQNLVLQAKINCIEAIGDEFKKLMTASMLLAMLAVRAFAAIGSITTPFAQSDEDLWDNDPSKQAAPLHDLTEMTTMMKTTTR